MEDKEIEQLLKESADKIKMKDFEERWEAISDRINANQSCECKEEIQSTVLVTSANRTQTHNLLRKRIIVSVCSIFAVILLCLAIVLPIVLKKDKGPKYYLFLNLTNSNVTESQFFDGIGKSDLTLIELSDFDMSSFTFYYTEDNKLVGGALELSDEELGVYSELTFYLNIVMSGFGVGTDYKDYSVNGYNVIYNTEYAEEAYTTKAKATKANMVYELSILSLDDNLESLFDKLFN